MSAAYWQQVHATGLSVPSDRPLPDLTAELTSMLGDPDPDLRDRTAYPTLATWIHRGVYDDLLSGLGDGMTAGLAVGLGESGTDTVFRRSFSVLVLDACLDRDNQQTLVPARKLLEWGDRIATWLLRERDVRAYVPGKGWAHAIAHGADALGTLARSPHLTVTELTVLLDVVADRVLMPATSQFTHDEADRLAAATMSVLRRDTVPLKVIEPWVSRVTATARRRWDGSPEDPFLVGGNAEAFLRALHIQLALGPEPPVVRPDLLLTLVDALRTTNPHYLRR